MDTLAFHTQRKGAGVFLWPALLLRMLCVSLRGMAIASCTAPMNFDIGPGRIKGHEHIQTPLGRAYLEPDVSVDDDLVVR